MIITLEPNQKIEIRFAHGRDEHGEPQTTDGIITVSYDDEAKRIKVSASEPDSSGRAGIIYSENYASPPSDVPAEKEEMIFGRVATITSEHLGVELGRIDLESDFIDDLGADSLDQVELVMAYEEEFGIHIPDEDADGVSTVGEVVRYLARRM